MPDKSSPPPPSPPSLKHKPPLTWHQLNGEVDCVESALKRACLTLCPGKHHIHAHATFKLSAPSSSTRPGKQPHWTARMSVCSTDMLGLMRHGFRWDASRCKTMLVLSVVPDDLRGRGYRWTRYFLFESRADEDPVKWRASLTVCFPHRGHLGAFNLDSVTSERIYSAKVRKWRPDGQEGFPYYSYEAGAMKPSSFNLLCGDMPLDGFWPWPKPDTDTDTDDKRNGAAKVRQDGTTKVGGGLRGNFQRLFHRGKEEDGKPDGTEELSRTRSKSRLPRVLITAH